MRTVCKISNLQRGLYLLFVCKHDVWHRLCRLHILHVREIGADWLICLHPRAIQELSLVLKILGPNWVNRPLCYLTAEEHDTSPFWGISLEWTAAECARPGLWIGPRLRGV